MNSRAYLTFSGLLPLAMSAIGAIGAVGALGVGCNSASLTDKSDAGTLVCEPHGVAFCDAGDPGSSGCVGDPNDPNTKYLPLGSPMPPGCKANIIGGPSDQVCTLLTSCVCTGDDSGTTPSWQCAGK